MGIPNTKQPVSSTKDPVHSGHLLLDISNSYSHCQEARRRFIRVKPLPRACLVPDDWHRRLCFCPPHRSCQSPSSSDSIPHPPERHINHHSSRQHNTCPLRTIHHCD